MADGAVAAERKRSVAYKLAVIDSGEPSPDNVAEYKVALRSLDPKCHENKTRIGNMTVTAQRLLRDEKAVDLTLLEILQYVDLSIPSDLPGSQPCSDVFTSFVVLTDRP